MTLVLATTKGLSTVEFSTGNLIKSYKQCENSSHSISLSGTNQNPKTILSLQTNKPLIHTYNFKREGVSKRIITPGKLSCIKISPNGKYLAAGNYEGTLYIWDLKSGSLFRCFQEAHFQKITVLEFSKDSLALVSGGADARVLIWSVMDLISQPNVNFRHNLTSHTLPITDLKISNGTFLESRLYTASEDGTCGVYSVNSGQLLFTLVTDTKILSLEIDPAERACYLGCANGLHWVPLYYENNKSLTSVGSAEGSAISTSKVETVLSVSAENSGATNSDAVTTIAVTNDGTHIVCGYSNGDIIAWETGSKQLVKRFKSPAGLITQITFISSLPNIDGDDTVQLLQRNVADLEDYVPNLQPLKGPVLDNYSEEINDILSAQPSANATAKETTNTVQDSESVEDLKSRLDQLQKMYDNLWAKYSSK